MNLDLGYINKVVTVSVRLNGDSVSLDYQILKKKKGEILFAKKGKGFSSVKDLVKSAGASAPFLLHFSGKGVLNRSVKKEENYRHNLLMQARLEDFYFTDTLVKDTIFSSVIRKGDVNEVIAQFKTNKVEVIAFSSGPFIAAPLIQFVKSNTIVVNKVELSFEDSQLTSFTKNEEFQTAILLGDEMISDEAFGAIATATNFFNPAEEIVIPEEEVVFEMGLAEAKQKNIFVRFGMGMMLLFLLILTGNYLYLGYVNSKIETNYTELAEFEDQLAQLSSLEDEKNRKEKLLRSSGLLNKNFLSFYLMNLSISVPKDIALEQVIVRPLVDDIKQRHKIEFNDHLVMISGQSKSSEILSKWIDKLKEEQWLSAIDILDYNYTKNIGNFELELVVY